MNSAEIGGETLRIDAPTWEPLLEFAPDHIDDFMWMFDVELEDGTRLHAYKHWWTRRYIHLADDGRAFAYIWPEDWEDREDEEDAKYREVCPECHLRLVLRGVDRLKSGIPGYTESYGEGDGLDAR
jgi:hypothetical protein